ncbi:MAG: hypothetical protein ACM3QS_05510, partial [Bacteroidota bacterium]
GNIQTLWAFVERYEGQYFTADIDLKSLVGQNVQFILTILASGSASGDRALWVGPVIYNPAVSPTATATSTMIATLPLTLTPSPTTVPPSATTGPSSTPVATGTPTPTETATPTKPSPP